MRIQRIVRYLTAATAVAAATIVPIQTAAAASDFTVEFPAGVACSFALDVSGSGGNNDIRHEANGLIVTGGTGSTLTFSGNGNTLRLPSNGAATLSRANPDGSQVLQLSGHNVLFFFPTDNPPGPSTFLVVGRALVGISAGSTFTLQSLAGHELDICAALS